MDVERHAIKVMVAALGTKGKAMDRECSAALSDLEILCAKQAIRSLKARYFRYMDTRDWAGMADVFAIDAVMDMRLEIAELVRAGLPVQPDGGLLCGREAIVAGMAAGISQTVTVHHGHMPEIELTSARTATGVWSMEDMVRMPAGAPCALLHGYGHYHEAYVCDRDDIWRIATLRLTRLQLTIS